MKDGHIFTTEELAEVIKNTLDLGFTKEQRKELDKFLKDKKGVLGKTVNYRIKG